MELASVKVREDLPTHRLVERVYFLSKNILILCYLTESNTAVILYILIILSISTDCSPLTIPYSSEFSKLFKAINIYCTNGAIRGQKCDLSNNLLRHRIVTRRVKLIMIKIGLQ